MTDSGRPCSSATRERSPASRQGAIQLLSEGYAARSGPVCSFGFRRKCSPCSTIVPLRYTIAQVEPPNMSNSGNYVKPYSDILGTEAQDDLEQSLASIIPNYKLYDEEQLHRWETWAKV